MSSRRLHTFSLMLALGTLGVILTGAIQAGSPAGEPHRGMGGMVAVLAGAMTILARGRVRQLAAGCLALSLMAGAVGLTLAASPWMTVLHACLAHLLFAGCAAVVVATSEGWEHGSAELADTGSPSLRTLGVVTPVVVMVQIFLGAIYRLLNLSAWPHLTGSLLVGCLLLYTGMVVLETHGEHAALRRAAQVLVGVTIAQMALGLGAFLGRVMAADGLEQEWWTILARTAHVACGAATLGASVAYAMQVFFHVRPGNAPLTNGGPIGKGVAA